MNTPRLLRPFPFPIGIGTDICQVSRIHAILRNPARGRRFVDRILSAEERDLKRVRMVLGNYKEEEGRLDNVEIARFIAGRFAAKEAAFKAWSPSRLTFHGISIRPPEGDPESGPVVAVVHGETFDQVIPVSISHDGDYATAVCLGLSTTDFQLAGHLPPTAADAARRADKHHKSKDGGEHGTNAHPRQGDRRREPHRRDDAQKKERPGKTKTRSHKGNTVNGFVTTNLY